MGPFVYKQGRGLVLLRETLMLESGCLELFANILSCDDEFVQHAFLDKMLFWEVKRYKSDMFRDLYKQDESFEDYLGIYIYIKRHCPILMRP